MRGDGEWPVWWFCLPREEGRKRNQIEVKEGREILVRIDKQISEGRYKIV